MFYLIVALLLALCLALLIPKFLRADPTFLARRIRKAIASSVLLGSVALALTGRMGLAIPLAMYGFSKLRAAGGATGGTTGGAHIMYGPPISGRSTFRSRLIIISFAHDHDQKEGYLILAGKEKQLLTRYSLDELLAWRGQILADSTSAALLAYYLDQRHPGWRQQVPSHTSSVRTQPSAISVAEACEILGVSASADATQIRTAYTATMRRVHPDLGGSTYIAARVNQARDLLLAASKHRQWSNYG